MNFDFQQDFLLLAERLGEADDEASYRTCVSRAYYAVFHAAKKLCEERGLEMAGRTTHSGVWQHFKPNRTGNRRDLIQLYKLARQLQDAREVADYEPLQDEVVWAEESKTSLRRCRKFLESLPGSK